MAAKRPASAVYPTPDVLLTQNGANAKCIVRSSFYHLRSPAAELRSRGLSMCDDIKLLHSVLPFDCSTCLCWIDYQSDDWLQSKHTLWT